MAQAEKEMLIPYNPAAKATPPKVSKKEPDYYQPEEMDKILTALDNAPLLRLFPADGLPLYGSCHC